MHNQGIRILKCSKYNCLKYTDSTLQKLLELHSLCMSIYLDFFCNMSLAKHWVL